MIRIIKGATPGDPVTIFIPQGEGENVAFEGDVRVVREVGLAPLEKAAVALVRSCQAVPQMSKVSLIVALRAVLAGYTGQNPGLRESKEAVEMALAIYPLSPVPAAAPSGTEEKLPF